MALPMYVNSLAVLNAVVRACAANHATPQLPNQRHKIVAKRGAAFTIMVAGESGLGKTTFINTLFSTTIKNYTDHKRRHAKQVDKTVEIEITKAELEEKFFKGQPIPLAA